MQEQAEQAKESVHSVFERYVTLLRKREADLISDVDLAKDQKDLELQLQKDELELLLLGVSHSVSFAEAILQEGSETEIAAGFLQVTARMHELLREQEGVFFGTIASSEIEFVGGRGEEAVGSIMMELGAVVSEVSISAPRSTVEPPPGIDHFINQVCSFKAILRNKEGDKISLAPDMNKVVKGLTVTVTGSSNTKVRQNIISFTFLQPLIWVVLCSAKWRTRAKMAR